MPLDSDQETETIDLDEVEIVGPPPMPSYNEPPPFEGGIMAADIVEERPLTEVDIIKAISRYSRTVSDVTKGLKKLKVGVKPSSK